MNNFEHGFFDELSKIALDIGGTVGNLAGQAIKSNVNTIGNAASGAGKALTTLGTGAAKVGIGAAKTMGTAASGASRIATPVASGAATGLMGGKRAQGRTTRRVSGTLGRIGAGLGKAVDTGLGLYSAGQEQAPMVHKGVMG